MPPSSDVLQGTLDLLVLKALSLAPLHRLERKGLVKSEWGTTENSREAKYYRLTAASQRALSTEMKGWRRFVEAIDLVLVADGGH